MSTEYHQYPSSGSREEVVGEGTDGRYCMTIDHPFGGGEPKSLKTCQQNFKQKEFILDYRVYAKLNLINKF